MTARAERPALNLKPDQERALGEIRQVARPGGRHVLSGFAGSGKTTLMQQLAQDLRKQGKSVVLTAPTHKAVSVLSSKITAAGITGVSCRTIHALLSLKPKPYGDRLVFERARKAEPVTEDVVVIDECSMVGAGLLAHIKRHLPNAFTLFVGDPAQLPPVNEEASQTFQTPGKSHLDTIVRQGAGNPILDAASAIRMSQGGPADWSWCRSSTAPPLGVYRPCGSLDAWLKKAFTSPEFEEDPDRYRYIAWTNDRVAEVNDKVRRWRYGDDIPTPFMPGERALLRGPVIHDGTTLFNTNEEAKVIEIRKDNFRFEFEECAGAAAWTADIPSWRIVLRGDAGTDIPVHMPASDRAYTQVVARVKDEATEARYRWKHLHDFQASMAKLQSIYSMTCHTAQGSTFGAVFLDIPDIRRRQSSNLLEMQQMLYVGVTRPSETLMLAGV